MVFSLPEKSEVQLSSVIDLNCHGGEVIRCGRKPRWGDSEAQVPRRPIMLPHSVGTFVSTHQIHPFVPFTILLSHSISFS